MIAQSNQVSGVIVNVYCEFVGLILMSTIVAFAAILVAWAMNKIDGLIYGKRSNYSMPNEIREVPVPGDDLVTKMAAAINLLKRNPDLTDTILSCKNNYGRLIKVYHRYPEFRIIPFPYFHQNAESFALAAVGHHYYSKQVLLLQNGDAN